MYVFRNVKVKARIVHDDDHVGVPLHNIQLTHLHITQDGGQVQQHRNKAHVGQLAVMLDHRTALGCHQVAAEEAEFRPRILLFQRPHQPRGMKVATGFSGYQIVLQKRNIKD